MWKNIVTFLDVVAQINKITLISAWFGPQNQQPFGGHFLRQRLHRKPHVWPQRRRKPVRNSWQNRWRWLACGGRKLENHPTCHDPKYFLCGAVQFFCFDSMVEKHSKNTTNDFLMVDKHHPSETHERYFSSPGRGRLPKRSGTQNNGNTWLTNDTWPWLCGILWRVWPKFLNPVDLLLNKQDINRINPSNFEA